MPEHLTGENPTTAKVKMLKASEFASLVEDFVKDLKEGRKLVDYDRFFSLLRGMHDPRTIRGWIEVLNWCKENEKETADGVELDFHPGRNRHIWERFLADLIVEINTKFTEAKDMVSTVGYLVGPPRYQPRQRQSELKFRFQKRTR